jgi:hypothetical protein
MFAILYSLGMFVADLFKSRCRLEAENLLLRHHHRFAAGTTSSSTAWQGSRAAHLDDPALAEPSWCGAGGSAGDHPALASRWFQNVLALEIA